MKCLSFILMTCLLFRPDATYAQNTDTTSDPFIYQTDNNRSTISFATIQNGSPVDGSFPITRGEIYFYPDVPEKSSTMIEVSVKDLILSQPALKESTTSEDWLDTLDFPAASFVSTAFRPTDHHTYVLEGALTVKDVTKPITATVTIVDYNALTFHATAHFIFDRTLFGVGWDDVSAVPADTRITIDLHAQHPDQ